MPNHFHHEDLRTELIENALILIKEEGEAKLSLRKLARTVGVSESAPYSHFKNKEDLISCTSDYITDKLYDSLKSTYDESHSVYKIGEAYVNFFLDHPSYFRFIFDQPCIKIDLSMNGKDDYKPFEFFRDATFEFLRKEGWEDEKIKFAVISMWSTVHGVASIASMKNVTTDFDWRKELEKILVN